jgi:hypothetical protein
VRRDKSKKRSASKRRTELGDDGLTELMRRFGIPLTREN